MAVLDAMGCDRAEDIFNFGEGGDAAISGMNLKNMFFVPQFKMVGHEPKWRVKIKSKSKLDEMTHDRPHFDELATFVRPST